jgi:hypothetical protein
VRNWARYVRTVGDLEHVSLRRLINDAVLGLNTVQMYLVNLDTGGDQVIEVLKVPELGTYGPTPLLINQLHQAHCHQTSTTDTSWTIRALTMIHRGRLDGVHAHAAEVSSITGEPVWSWCRLDALEPEQMFDLREVRYDEFESMVVEPWARRTCGWLQALMWSLESERLLHEAQEGKHREDR